MIFAVAQRGKAWLSGWYKPCCAGGQLGTTVRDARHYTSLIQRWFIFLRESLMRHLHGPTAKHMRWRRCQCSSFRLALLLVVFASPTPDAWRCAGVFSARSCAVCLVQPTLFWRRGTAALFLAGAAGFS
ncbi:MAG: hypothetical protein U0074_08860 [Kouleothrix sp.]